MFRHHHPSMPQHFTGCIQLCSPSRQTCMTPQQNPWTTSPTPTTFSDRQQYQGWVLTISGSAHPVLGGSLSQPRPGNKRKNGLTSKLYLGAWRVPRDRVFGSRINTLPNFLSATDDNIHMLKLVQSRCNRICLVKQRGNRYLPTLPNWMENSTNAFHKACTDSKDICTIHGNIPKQ